MCLVCKWVHDKIDAAIRPDLLNTASSYKYICYGSPSVQVDVDEITPKAEASTTPISYLEKVISNPWLDLSLSCAHINVNEQYVKLKFYDFFKNNNIVIRSGLGTGKTELMTQWIKQNKIPKIVYISNRCTLSQSMSSRLNFKSYQDLERDIYLSEHNKVVC